MALSFGFVLLPHFTLSAFSTFVDTLRLAADEGDFSRPVDCSWSIMADNPAGATASCGAHIADTESLGDPARFDYVVLCGGLLHRGEVLSDRVRAWLHEADRKGVTLVGICTGSLLLARAGLLSGKRCCVSWFHYRELLEEIPDVVPVADQLFVVDGRRITCAGGIASADLAAWLVEGHFGKARAQKSLNILSADHARRPNAPQPQPPSAFSVRNERARRAALLMEQNLADPLTIAEIAERVSISRRQLDRIFRRELGVSPQVFYRNLRLQMARHLLVGGRRSVTDVALECGFADAAHFSRLFKALFGHPPSHFAALCGGTDDGGTRVDGLGARDADRAVH